jgi:hypothetical protein
MPTLDNHILNTNHFFTRRLFSPIPATQRSCRWFSNTWRSLQPKPVEQIALRLPTSKLPQGKVRLRYHRASVSSLFARRDHRCCRCRYGSTSFQMLSRRRLRFMIFRRRLPSSLRSAWCCGALRKCHAGDVDYVDYGDDRELNVERDSSAFIYDARRSHVSDFQAHS